MPLGIAWWGSPGGRRPRPTGVLLGLISGTIEAGYFILLSAAYRRGDLSVVYPLARGTAPLLAVVIGVGLLGERLGVAGLARGRAAAGRVPLAPAAVAGRCGGGRGGSTRSILFALATGVTIATYSAIDRVGTRLIDPVPYAAILWMTTCVVPGGLGRVRGRRRDLLRRPRAGRGGPRSAGC